MRKYFITTERETGCKTQPENRTISEKVNGRKRKACKSRAVVLVQSYK